jgi:uncharacterized membrane protein (DUF2068 family)
MVERAGRGRFVDDLCEDEAMRLVPRRWNNETWICSIRGHYCPAADAVRVRPDDVNLGVDLDDGTRVARCLRCDAWIRTPRPSPDEAAFDVAPPLSELDLPRRGKPLEDAILLRLIAVDRAVHGVLFTLAAVTVLIVELQLPRIHEWANSLYDDVNGAIDNTSRSGHTVLSEQLERVLHIDRGELKVVLAVLVAYAVVESVEAVGLWREKRWAEYLTVVATAGLLPLEIHELTQRVSVLRVGGLVVNLLILVYLVYAKRLFGVRGGAAALQEQIDWDAILASPISPHHTPVKA